jgi:hypothetical protein
MLLNFGTHALDLEHQITLARLRPNLNNPAQPTHSIQLLPVTYRRGFFTVP